MAYTQPQLTAIRNAYALGALTVEYAGQRITYRSRAEMKQIIDEMDAEVNPPAAGPTPNTSFVQFSRD